MTVLRGPLRDARDWIWVSSVQSKCSHQCTIAPLPTIIFTWLDALQLLQEATWIHLNLHLGIFLRGRAPHIRAVPLQDMCESKALDSMKSHQSRKGPGSGYRPGTSCWDLVGILQGLNMTEYKVMWVRLYEKHPTWLPTRVSHQSELLMCFGKTCPNFPTYMGLIVWIQLYLKELNIGESSPTFFTSISSLPLY